MTGRRCSGCGVLGHDIRSCDKVDAVREESDRLGSGPYRGGPDGGKHPNPSWQVYRVENLLHEAREDRWSIEETASELSFIGEDWTDRYVAEILGLDDLEDDGTSYEAWLVERDPAARRLPGHLLPDGMGIRRAVALLARACEAANEDREYAAFARHLLRRGGVRSIRGQRGATPLLGARAGGCGRLTAALVADNPSMVHHAGWILYPYQGVAAGRRAIVAHEWAQTGRRIVDPVWGDAGPRIYLGCPRSQDVWTTC